MPSQICYLMVLCQLSCLCVLAACVHACVRACVHHFKKTSVILLGVHNFNIFIETIIILMDEDIYFTRYQ